MTTSKALLLLGTLAPISGELAAQDHPNIVFFMVDDLGIGDLGVYGQRYIKTPAIDRLAQEGMTFTQHYAGCTVSAPSRGSLLTGKHTGHAYIRGNKDTPNPDGHTYDQPLAAEEFTLAELLKQAGYHTACIGKWGLGGPNTPGAPIEQGFDYFFGYLGQLNAHRHYPEFLHEGNTLVKLDGNTFAQDLLIDRALDYLDRCKATDEPFFLYFTPALPHADLDIPEEERLAYDGQFLEAPPKSTGGYKPVTHPRSTYAAMVSRIDSDVQKLIDRLRKNGQLDNTLFIFTSDNGAHKEGGHDPYFFDSNGPYRGTKRDLYEGGIRTPLIVCWPKVTKPGSVSYHISAFWDFLPTLAEMTGQAIPANTDGISLMPTLTGKGEQKQHRYLYWEFMEEGGKRATRCGDWKLIQLQANTPKKTHYELYDLSADPGELNDVSHLYPHIVQQLKPILEQEHTPSTVYGIP